LYFSNLEKKLTLINISEREERRTRVQDDDFEPSENESRKGRKSNTSIDGKKLMKFSTSYKLLFLFCRIAEKENPQD
jgi:hypothetical protein